MHVKSRTGARGVPRSRSSIAPRVPWITGQPAGPEAGPSATARKVPRPSSSGRRSSDFCGYAGPDPVLRIPEPHAQPVRVPGLPDRSRRVKHHLGRHQAEVQRWCVSGANESMRRSDTEIRGAGLVCDAAKPKKSSSLYAGVFLTARRPDE